MSVNEVNWNKSKLCIDQLGASEAKCNLSEMVMPSAKDILSF